MILTGPEIVKQREAGHIIIEPFTPEQITPNSYDFRLGEEIRKYTVPVLDPRQEMPTEIVPWEDNGTTASMILHPGTVYLAQTLEIMGSRDSNRFAPMIKGKSSIARLGLFVHISSGLIDPGFVGQWTLTLHAVQPVRVYRGMLIGQATFWALDGAPVDRPRALKSKLEKEKSDGYQPFNG